jgi:hypothetical protein
MKQPPQTLPAIDFATFVLSLASNALVHLGELPDPDGDGARAGAAEAAGAPTPNVGPPNLALAKQTIDILAMLEAKTQGNLDDGEARLLSSVLYDLRVKYVDKSRAR